MDAVQKANSGHPGTPMALAPVAYTIWQRFLRYDPHGPVWPNRDRFILSAGHASMLLYSLLHLAGVKSVTEDGATTEELAVPLHEIERFRQLGSRCPGHPEYRPTAGVECTTGPLGQGVAMSVGMAAARWKLADYFHRPGFDLFDYDVYVLCSDGDLMEGIGGEAASLAGHLKLSNLCWVYDDNRITIEGSTHLAFSEDVATRFDGYGWNVARVDDANDLGATERALTAFKKTDDRPTLVVVRSHIAYGAPNKHDTAAAHGEPLGEEEVRLAKRAYGWPEDARFLVPEGVREHFAAGLGRRGRMLHDAWHKQMEDYRKAHPHLAEQLECMQRRELPDRWDRDLPSFPADPEGLATRESSGKVLNALAAQVPWLVGGAADLAPSTKTRLDFDGAGDFDADSRGGNNFHFGVREHAMAAAANGMSLATLRPYAATFLIFSDYAKPAIRLSALMELPVVYVFTHDSIGLGEDGPTHQPIEQLAALRATPGLVVLRPADANEVVEAWKVIMRLARRPAALVLSRQKLATLDRTRYASASGVARGAYVLADAAGGRAEAVLLATGSEVAVALEAHERLRADGIMARVVSMPSWELFDAQERTYREEVLLSDAPAHVAIEAGSPLGWERYVGPRGRVIAMRGFGASAPCRDVQRHFGFTADDVVETVRGVLGAAAGKGDQ